MANKLQKLKGKIISCGYTQNEFADKIGMSDVSLNYKLNGHKAFKTTEVKLICDVLGIKQTEIAQYFF